MIKRDKTPRLIRNWLTSKELKWNKYNGENFFSEENGEKHIFIRLSPKEVDILDISYENKI